MLLIFIFIHYCSDGAASHVTCPALVRVSRLPLALLGNIHFLVLLLVLVVILLLTSTAGSFFALRIDFLIGNCTKNFAASCLLYSTSDYIFSFQWSGKLLKTSLQILHHSCSTSKSSTISIYTNGFPSSINRKFIYLANIDHMSSRFVY